jgi:hypothetical protein
LGSADADRAESANLLAKQIRNHQHHDEDAGKQIIVFEDLGLFGQVPIIEEPRSQDRKIAIQFGPAWDMLG